MLNGGLKSGMPLKGRANKLVHVVMLVIPIGTRVQVPYISSRLSLPHLPPVHTLTRVYSSQ